MKLPIERILWAPTNRAHYNHLHVVGVPRMAQWELPTKYQITSPIQIIMKALDERFGKGDHYQVWDDSLGWTHMGIYNDRYIGGTTTWSQHAGGNAIDIGPYYGVEEQRIFYDFLTGKEENMALTSHEEQVLKHIVAALDEVGSNGSFAKYTVQHLRNHPTAIDNVDEQARSIARHANSRIDDIADAAK